MVFLAPRAKVLSSHPPRFLSFLCVSASLRETLGVALLIWACVVSSSLMGDEPALKMVEQKTQAELERIAGGVNGVAGIVVEDLGGPSRFAVNEDREFAQASAIKIPILMEVLKEAHEGKIKLTDQHWVEKKTQVAGSGILSELGDHTTQMSVEDLCNCMIILSDNTATNMILDLVGKENVTATMKSLGCPHTQVRRRMLDTAASARGDENTSTPAEAARLLRLLHEGKFINREVCDHALKILRKPKPGAVNAAIPKDIPVAFKPGGIPGVATEWAIVELPGRPYIVVFMGAYDVDNELEPAIRATSKAAYDFFSRLVNATKYGAYIDPKEWAKP